MTANQAEGLREIKARFDACSVAVKPMDKHRDGLSFECPLCHGDGYLDSDTFDTSGSDQSYVGLQTFGIGKRLLATNEFVRHLAADFQWLLEQAALASAPADEPAVQGESADVSRHCPDCERLAAEVERLLSNLRTIYREADDERLEEGRKRGQEAERWKAEGDWFGWNFHKGYEAGTIGASFAFYRIAKAIDEALAAAQPQRGE